MFNSPRIISALLFVLCVDLAACERKLRKEEPELVEDCEALCDSLSASDVVVESACVDDCIEGLSEAEAIGPACEEAYRDLTSCFGDLSVHERVGWWDNRRVGIAENYDYVCEDATTPFLELCPGVWYND